MDSRRKNPEQIRTCCGVAPGSMARPHELGYFEWAPIMRLAIVAASSYEANGQVPPIPNAEVDVELFGRRLADFQLSQAALAVGLLAISGGLV